MIIPTVAGLYIHLESSFPRSKGESVRFESPHVISSYKCVAFWYHMWGKHIGRLNVFLVDRLRSEKLLWRLSGDQGNFWNEGKIRVNRGFAFKVRKVVKLSVFLQSKCRMKLTLPRHGKKFTLL